MLDACMNLKNEGRGRNGSDGWLVGMGSKAMGQVLLSC